MRCSGLGNGGSELKREEITPLNPPFKNKGGLVELTHGGLFEGIGGFSLAARWAGIKTEWVVENNKWCKKLLKKHFPEAEQHGDIKETRNLRTVDIITGGFPCQPFSVAGKRKGKEDDRALWPEMLRIIKESKPAWVIGENVAGIINMELDTVLSDLEGEGFETQAFVIPACGINAWHRRNRVWILAYSADNGRRRRSDRQCGADKREFQQEEQEGSAVWDKVEGRAGKRAIAESGKNTGIGTKVNKGISSDNNKRKSGPKHERKSDGTKYPEFSSDDRSNRKQNITSDTIGVAAGAKRGGLFGKGGEAESEAYQRERLRAGFEHIYEVLADSYFPGWKEQWEREPGREELSSFECGSWWQTEPGVGRVVHGLSGRVDRLRGLGNAIVPEIVYVFFMMILEVERQMLEATPIGD